MDTRVPERMAPRSEEGAKGSESSEPYPPNQLVRMRSPVQIWVAAPKILENFGFRGFFVVNLYFFVWVKMWVSWLNHILTHTSKGPERFKKCRTGRFAFPSGFFVYVTQILIDLQALSGDAFTAPSHRARC